MEEDRTLLSLKNEIHEHIQNLDEFLLMKNLPKGYKRIIISSKKMVSGFLKFINKMLKKYAPIIPRASELTKKEKKKAILFTKEMMSTAIDLMLVIDNTYLNEPKKENDYNSK